MHAAHRRALGFGVVGAEREVAVALDERRRAAVAPLQREHEAAALLRLHEAAGRQVHCAAGGSFLRRAEVEESRRVVIEHEEAAREARRRAARVVRALAQEAQLVPPRVQTRGGDGGALLARDVALAARRHRRRWRIRRVVLAGHLPLLLAVRVQPAAPRPERRSQCDPRR